MATLGNILARKGGTPMTGRTVRLTLACPDPSGVPVPQETEVLLLPVSLAKKARAFRSAEAYVAEQQKVAEESGIPNCAPSLFDERVLRFLCEAMRDPQDARRYFVAAKEIDSLRDILLDEQIEYLSREYTELVRSEYHEIQSDDVAGMKADAKSAFLSGQA